MREILFEFQKKTYVLTQWAHDVAATLRLGCRVIAMLRSIIILRENRRRTKSQIEINHSRWDGRQERSFKWNEIDGHC